MLNRGAKGKLAEAVDSEAELFRSLQGAGNDCHVTQVLFGGGPALVNSAGVPFSGAYVDSIGEPTADLRSNIAAEARAKIVYERLINVTEDVGVKDALTFLMTREIAHQKSFEKALYCMDKSFPPGKLRATRVSPTCMSTRPQAKATQRCRGTVASSGRSSPPPPKTFRSMAVTGRRLCN